MQNQKKKISAKSLSTKINNKPNTVTRAAITANLKFTRGKQLVEHEPFLLIPDPQNPRPGELIDDQWLLKNLKLGTKDSLCRFDDVNNEYIIPNLDDLKIYKNNKLEESYNFLRDLAFSIRNDGLIEPIEIFLADRNNDPDYFINNDLEFGYVVLEGHQRRLAAMMASVSTVTCVEIIDESMLAKLKVKHRKLRRQLSENNLRKGLTVSQNVTIVSKLLSGDDFKNIKSQELANITGLNQKICQALIKVLNNKNAYPPIMFSMIDEDKLTFKRIRELVSKSYEEIEMELRNKKSPPIKKKARGTQGGKIKRSATFKVKDEKETHQLLSFLFNRFPEIQLDNESKNEFKSLEAFLNQIKQLALAEE